MRGSVVGFLKRAFGTRVAEPPGMFLELITAIQFTAAQELRRRSNIDLICDFRLYRAFGDL